MGFDLLHKRPLLTGPLATPIYFTAIPVLQQCSSTQSSRLSFGLPLGLFHRGINFQRPNICHSFRMNPSKSVDPTEPQNDLLDFQVYYSSLSCTIHFLRRI